MINLPSGSFLCWKAEYQFQFVYYSLHIICLRTEVGHLVLPFHSLSNHFISTCYRHNAQYMIKNSPFHHYFLERDNSFFSSMCVSTIFNYQQIRRFFLVYIFFKLKLSFNHLWQLKFNFQQIIIFLIGADINCQMV